MENQLSKHQLREKWKQQAAQLSSNRKNNAKQSLSFYLLEELGRYPKVLSFSSLKSEIDTSLLNQTLAKQGRLYLPKVVNDSIEIYPVTSLKPEGGFYDPDPRKSTPISPDKIDVVLVPALAFDNAFYRVGYGKGYYDRFLATLAPHIETWGVGFEEQLVEAIAVEPHDIKLTRLLLF